MGDHGKQEVFSRLDELRTAVFGEAIKILPETFLLKFDKHRFRYGNGYIVRHENRKEVIVIDAVREEHRKELFRFRESGYTIAAIILTHSDLIGQAYDDLAKISGKLETKIFIHNLDRKQTEGLEDLENAHEILNHFQMRLFHFAGHTPGSIMIYDERNKAVFAGDSAVGSPYEEDEYHFDRPPISDDTMDGNLATSWKAFAPKFKHLLPLHGKPQFDISDAQRKSIINQLSKSTKTQTL